MSLVKAKTPKVILYSSQAKCLLMENGPEADFEVNFYSGWKLVRTQGKLVITEPNGSASSWPLSKGEPLLDREANREMWYHVKETLAHCERIEAAVNQLAALPISNGSLPFFPLTIGRKPPAPSPTVKHLAPSNKENQMSPMAEPLLSGLKSFDGSVRSTVSNVSKASSVRHPEQQKPSYIIHTVDVPGIGRAVRKSTGSHKSEWFSLYNLTLIYCWLMIRRRGDSFHGRNAYWCDT